jgi:hypothetical protein
MKPTAKSISALPNSRAYKDESFIHQNLKKKRKIAPRVNPQHANIPFHKPSILINLQIHTITLFAPIINTAN